MLKTIPNEEIVQVKGLESRVKSCMRLNQRRGC